MTLCNVAAVKYLQRTSYATFSLQRYKNVWMY